MGVLQDLEKLILPAEDLNAAGVPSASLAILEDGKISSHVISSGKENDETVYQACSISKPITGLAVAKLVDEGRLSYDMKVIDHLEQSTIDCLVDHKTSHLLSHVTVGMLLSHTSGLSQHGFPGYQKEIPTAEDVLSGRYPSNTPQVSFLYFPGQQWSYSGGGFTVLQVFLENFTKIPFPELMRTTVLEALGMTRSWYGKLPPNDNNYTDAHWTAYTKAGRNSFIELAAAGLWTTPTDLLKAISAVQESLYTSKGFITSATAKKMLSPVASGPELKGMGMALGFGVLDQLFAHSGGNDPGYRCHAVGFNDIETRRRDGIVVMTNGLLGEKINPRIVNAIFYLKGWKRQKSMPMLYNSDEEFAPLAAAEGSAVGDGWKEWTGKWEEEWEIVDEGGPAIVFKSFKPMKLKVAAAPAGEMEEGKEFVFVVDGLGLGLRLTWADERRVVRTLQGNTKTLQKTSPSTKT